VDPVGLEDGAEFSIFAANQPAFVGGFGDRALPGLSIDFSGRGWYRLRVRASGRAAARDLVVPEACESYRIDVWRADHAEPVALTHSATEPAAVRARRQADLRRWAAQGSEQIAEFLNRSHHAPGPRLSAEDQAALERGQDRLRTLAERLTAPEPVLGEGRSTTLELSIGRNSSSILTELPDGTQIQAEGEDFFEALCQLRLVLEASSRSLLCAGARRDGHPSSIHRQMAQGRPRATNWRLGPWCR
jgi:hypothetical protein